MSVYVSLGSSITVALGTIVGIGGRERGMADVDLIVDADVAAGVDVVDGADEGAVCEVDVVAIAGAAA